MDATRKQLMCDQVIRILWTRWLSAMPKPSKEPQLLQPRSGGGRLSVGRWPFVQRFTPTFLRVYQLWSAIQNPSEATSLLFAKSPTEAAWYQRGRGRTKHFDGFFETARGICESSAHPDRDSLLADIYFCLGSIAMDTNDFNGSRIFKELSLDLVSSICNELGTDGRYKEGEADLKEALRIRKALRN
ncbi:tetratricopeptide repeat domain-containing protein [Aspergillus flavus]|nr:tetratricopeptide repeat domain-containing protein [Aspergillus flavus]